MKIVFTILGGIAFLVFAVLVYIGAIGPETAIYTARQIPKRYLATINELKLLQDNEEIKYFYSDAMTNIKDGFYFVTNENLVIYSNEWDEPAEIIPLKEIITLDVQYDDSPLIDSIVYIETVKDLEIDFPLSSEMGLDKKFIEVIQKNKANTELEEPKPN